MDLLSLEVDVSRKTVFNWKKRWLALEAIPLEELTAKERLEDLPRPGAPSVITADQRCQLEALACESPEKCGRPNSEWTGREIADELLKRKGVLPYL
ncbi:helix-turn-helix domain-containing protein [Chloroflexi bacterium TSY]|nr:helix-turn-helix domain-containing protein [Chloroflexi bacterium TSY]